GASRGALLSTVGPPATAVMAYFLYGERLSAFQLLGTVLVVVSIALLEWQSSQRRTSPT
ncbi:MAG: EamA family transporter, partial [Cellvibrionales bacterium]